jgi:hypothetical protein
MFETYSAAGYDLYEAFDDNWVIDLKNGNAFYGSFTDVIKYMISNLDFYHEDIEIAVQEMCQSKLNASHFGLNKTFIYSFSKEIVLDKVS